MHPCTSNDTRELPGTLWIIPILARLFTAQRTRCFRLDYIHSAEPNQRARILSFAGALENHCLGVLFGSSKAVDAAAWCCRSQLAMQASSSDATDETVAGTQGVSVIPVAPRVLQATAALPDTLTPGIETVVSSWQPNDSDGAAQPPRMTPVPETAPFPEHGIGTLDAAAPSLPAIAPSRQTSMPTCVPGPAAAAPAVSMLPVGLAPAIAIVPVGLHRTMMRPLKFLGMQNGQPVFQEMVYDSQHDNVFAAAGGELMYETGHGCLPLPYIQLSCTALPVGSTGQQSQGQRCRRRTT